MMKEISHKFRFILSLSLLNLALSAYAVYLYFPNLANGGGGLKNSIYFLCAAFSHFYFYFFLVNFILIYPILFVFKNKKILLFCIFLVNILAQIVLLSDAHLFYLYRFHLSFAMLDLFFNTGGEVIQFSLETTLSIVFEILIMCVCVFVVSICAFYLQGFKRLFITFLCAFFVYISVNLTHAYASAKSNSSILIISNNIPLYKPLTMNSFLYKLGVVSEDNLSKNDFKIAQNGNFYYPKKALLYKEEFKAHNILILLSDSLRADMLNSNNMPRTNDFAKNASLYTQHFSSSNSTRGGIFGLFYGLPPSYWHLALSSGKGAALLEALQYRDYHLGIFTTARLNSPEFHRTVFSRVKNLRLKSQGDTFIEREQNTIKDFEAFIKSHDASKPFFSFIFLDNIHAYAFPSNFNAKFKPFNSVNHLTLNKDSNASEYFNLYQNAVLYTDENFNKIVQILKDKGVFDNTIIIISSDHGEEFNEDRDNYWGHNGNFKDYQIKIPLIIKWAYQTQGQIISEKTSAYDISTTLMQEVLGVENETRDYSIGQNLFKLTPRPYVLAGSYTENAIVEDERIIIIDVFGLLHFKDKRYKTHSDTSRKNLLTPYKIFYEYLQKD